MTIVYIYSIDSLECMARPTVTTTEEFKEKPNLFYPLWDEKTMKFSKTLLNNPTIDSKNGELREMTEIEKVKSGKTTLSDGSYLDEVNETIVTIAKPNEWSIWDKDSHTWKVDNDLLNTKLKELREKALKDLAEAKSNFLNQPLEIEKAGFCCIQNPAYAERLNRLLWAPKVEASSTRIRIFRRPFLYFNQRSAGN